MCVRLLLRHTRPSSTVFISPLSASPLRSARPRCAHGSPWLLPRKPALHDLLFRPNAPSFSPHAVQSSSGSALAAILAALIVAGALYALVPGTGTTISPSPAVRQRDPALPKPIDDVLDYYLAMTTQVAPGRPGNLTAQEEAGLRELWRATLQVLDVYKPPSTPETNGTAAPKDVEASPDKKKKSRLSLFRRRNDKEDEAPPPPSPNAVTDFSTVDENDKHGVGRDFKRAMSTMTPAELREAFWSMMKHDNPDAMLLRFLRARKWDIQAALVMMISAIHWRAVEMHLDDDIMPLGDAGAVKDKEGSDAAKKQEAEYFLQQLEMGKSFVHGVDKEGRPMCIVKVRLHRAGDQSPSSLERLTVYTMETARFMLKPPVDTATVVFDMTDFTLANMDYHPVKFIIKCFEANYPECLGAVLVHKAPWIFQGIWAIIKGWLDPVVASKVHFTRNYEELTNFVPPKQIPTELGGEEKWEYDYVLPVEGENKRMEDHEARDKLIAHRASIYKQFEAKTMEWIKEASAISDNSEAQQKSKPLMEERMKFAEELRKNYWDIDPYIRARSFYDRVGVLNEGGRVDYYPKKQEAAPKEEPSPAAEVAPKEDAKKEEVQVNGVEERKLEDKAEDGAPKPAAAPAKKEEAVPNGVEPKEDDLD